MSATNNNQRDEAENETTQIQCEDLKQLERTQGLHFAEGGNIELARIAQRSNPCYSKPPADMKKLRAITPTNCKQLHDKINQAFEKLKKQLETQNKQRQKEGKDLQQLWQFKELTNKDIQMGMISITAEILDIVKSDAFPTRYSMAISDGTCEQPVIVQYWTNIHENPNLMQKAEILDITLNQKLITKIEEEKNSDDDDDDIQQRQNKQQQQQIPNKQQKEMKIDTEENQSQMEVDENAIKQFLEDDSDSDSNSEPPDNNQKKDPGMYKKRFPTNTSFLINTHNKQ